MKTKQKLKVWNWIMGQINVVGLVTVGVRESGMGESMDSWVGGRGITICDWMALLSKFWSFDFL